MVTRKTGRRTPVKRKAVITRKRGFGVILICGLVVLVITFVTRAILIYLNPEQYLSDDMIDFDTEEIVPPKEEPEPEIAEIDFQPTIEAWAKSIGGKKGIIIYDLDRDEVAGSYNADVNFATASLYKLFVVYEGYRRVQNGTWDANEIVGWTRRTVRECLDLAIRESNSACAETLWSMIGHEEMNAIAQNEFGITGVIVSNSMATPREIMQIMRIFYQHTEIEDEGLVALMQDSFLNQPITTYNWRQGLPNGFSDKVKVYNKVGWNYNGEQWTIYDDAAILDFVDESRHFIVVVMTGYVPYQQIRYFGTLIEEAFYNQNVLKN